MHRKKVNLTYSKEVTMSKVILKIGPSTTRVEQDEIITITFGDTPKTTIKYAKDHSVVFFDRNPYYATITNANDVKTICTLLDLYSNETDEMKSTQYLGQAMTNIHSVICVYVSNQIFDDFPEAIINALKNAKNIGRRQALQRLNGNSSV